MATHDPAPAIEEPQSVHEGLMSLLEAEDKDVPEEQAKDEPEQASGDDDAQVESAQEAEESEEQVAEEEPATEAPKTWRVKVDGEEVEVPEDELLRGYSRQQDYTRKTMDLAEKRKALEAEAERVRGERAQYNERLEQVKSLLTAQMGKEPDWDRLKAENPAEYAAQWADRERQEKARAKIEAEQARLQQAEWQEQQSRLQARLAEERQRLLDMKPEWKTPDVMVKDQQALLEYGKQVGFTDDELGSLYDHRAVLILDKARRWDEAQKGKPNLTQKVKEAPVLKPGAKQTVTRKSSAKESAFQKARKSGRPQDVAEAIGFLLDEGL